MKKICLLGGKLQAFEVMYHARKLNMKVILVDKNPDVLIKDLVDEFHCFDIIQESEKLIDISKNVDYVIPVNENFSTIDFLEKISNQIKCYLLFDFDSYRISRDKKESKKYFKSINISTPLDNPTLPPYFIKPSCESGSVGTKIIYNDSDLKKIDPTMLIEEYVPGDVMSLEVVGDGKHFTVIKETKIHIDDNYDCHMVTPAEYNPKFRKIAYKLACNLKLKGIMDVEAINNINGIKTLEIDARFPSQTPITVYYSTGINLLQLLIQAYEHVIEEKIHEPAQNYCIFEHLLLKDEQLIPVGEHILSMNKNYRQVHRSEHIEIFQCDGKYDAFTVIVWNSDQKMAQMERKKAHEIIVKLKK